MDELNEKQIISKLRQDIRDLETELYHSQSTAGSRVYTALVDEAVGSGMELLTDVAYEMVARIADLEVQRDEAILPSWAGPRWRPAEEAPELVPLLFYCCPWPNAPDDESKPEYWGVGVRRNKGGVTNWHMLFPTWEGGCGVPYQCEPDFFIPLPSRPRGNPKWVTEGDIVRLVRDDGEVLEERLHMKQEGD